MSVSLNRTRLKPHEKGIITRTYRAQHPGTSKKTFTNLSNENVLHTSAYIAKRRSATAATKVTPQRAAKVTPQRAAKVTPQRAAKVTPQRAPCPSTFNAPTKTQILRTYRSQHPQALAERFGNLTRADACDAWTKAQHAKQVRETRREVWQKQVVVRFAKSLQDTANRSAFPTDLTYQTLTPAIQHKIEAHPRFLAFRAREAYRLVFRRVEKRSPTEEELDAYIHKIRSGM